MRDGGAKRLTPDKKRIIELEHELQRADRIIDELIEGKRTPVQMPIAEPLWKANIIDRKECMDAINRVDAQELKARYDKAHADATDQIAEAKAKLAHEKFLTDAANKQRELSLKRLQVVANQNKLLNQQVHSLETQLNHARETLKGLAEMSGIGPAQKIARDACWRSDMPRSADNFNGQISDI